MEHLASSSKSNAFVCLARCVARLAVRLLFTAMPDASALPSYRNSRPRYFGVMKYFYAVGATRPHDRNSGTYNLSQACGRCCSSASAVLAGIAKMRAERFELPTF